MLKSGFVFLLGGILGGALVLAISSSGDPSSEPTPDANVGATAPPPPRPRLAPEIYVDSDATDVELAGFLTLAEFDRQWGPVGEVAQALRERRSPSEPPEPAAIASLESRSLAGLDHSYREQIAAIKLAGRDNPATRLVRSGQTVEQITQGLTELLLAPLLSPRDRRVRRDAALLLARHPDPRARQVLLDVLEQADLFEVAVNALARAQDPAANGILLAVLESDQDPERRAVATAALARTRSLAEGTEVADGLSRAALEDLDPTVRSHAIAALARADLFRSATARDTLVGLVADQSEPLDLRRAGIASLQAQIALTHTLPTSVIESLQVLANTERGPLRREVVLTLGTVGGARTVELLEALLPTLAGEDREAVQAALDQLKRRVVPE